LVKQTIQTVIIGNSKGEKCDARCGVDWSSSEVIAQAREQIKDRFGDGIQLEYLDLAEATSNHPALEGNQAIRDKSLPLPLLLINGEPRISGEFDIRLLMDAIDTEMEIKS